MYSDYLARETERKMGGMGKGVAEVLEVCLFRWSRWVSFDQLVNVFFVLS